MLGKFMNARFAQKNVLYVLLQTSVELMAIDRKDGHKKRKL